MPVSIQWKLLNEHAKVPQRQKPGDRGMDIYATEKVTLPGLSNWAAVGTGLSCFVPYTHEIQIRPRSGLALKKGVTILNSVPVIDDYRGEIKIILVNFGSEPFTVNPGDRIAQIVVSPVELDVDNLVVDELPASQRGSAGFGSTGI